MKHVEPALAAAAALERDERVRLYPGLVAQGKIGKAEADDDTAAWGRIAEWLATGQFRLPERHRGPIWTPLAAAAAQALKRREAAYSKNPLDRRLRERLDNVATIHARLGRLAEAFEEPEMAAA